MKSKLALASLTLCGAIVGCGDSGGVPAPQNAQPRPVDPKNQVTPADAKFKSSFQSDGSKSPQ